MEQNITLQPLGGGVYIYTAPHHSFGTDAVLLASFARARKNDRMADLGTGCGIIPFLMLRDGLLSSAVGIDISREACELAGASAEKNSFLNFSVINSDLNDLSGKVNFGSNTLVTCNPPYKAVGAGLKNPDPVCCTARHETACTLEDTVRVGAKLLQTSGRLCMCQRPERMAELMELMRKYRVEPKRMRLVAQEKGKKPWLFLIEGRRCGNTGLDIEPTLYIEENGGPSEEMTEIYGKYFTAAEKNRKQNI